MKKNLIHQSCKLIIIIIIFIIILRLFWLNSSLFYLKRPFPPFSIHLNKQDLVLEKGEEYRLFVYAINKRVSYSSTDFKVADVDSFGRVFAYKRGKTFIMAKVDGKVLKCRIRVVELSKKRLHLKVGETYQLKVKGIKARVKWKSSNANIQVSSNGKIKGIKKGKTVVTAKVKGKELKCIVIIR